MSHLLHSECVLTSLDNFDILAYGCSLFRPPRAFEPIPRDFFEAYRLNPTTYSRVLPVEFF